MAKAWLAYLVADKAAPVLSSLRTKMSLLPAVLDNVVEPAHIEPRNVPVM
jgi:hypothetical protein